MRVNWRIRSTVTSLIAFAVMSAGLGAPLQTAENITFRAPVEPLNVILERLGGEIGRELAVSQEGSQHYLYIDVTDVTVSQLLNAIAESTKSVWADAGTALHLVPDTTLRRREALDERNAILAELQAQIAQPIEVERVEGIVEDVRRRTERLTAVREVVRAVDLNAVAAMMPGDRIVFAENPNAYQRGFRGNVSRQKARLIADLNDDRSEENPEFGADEFFLMLRDMMNLLGVDESEFEPFSKPIDANQTKMVLIVFRSDMRTRDGETRRVAQDFSFEVAFLDADGRSVGSSYGALGSRSSRNRPVVRDPEVGDVDDPDTGVTVTVESAEEEFFGGVFATDENVPYEIEYPEAIHYLMEKTSYYSPTDTEPLTRPELEEILLNPEVHDPLSMVCGPILEKVGPTLGANIVINVSDDLLVRSDYGSMNLPRTVERGAGWLSTITEIRDEGEIVVGLPRDLNVAMNNRLNRVQLGRFLRRNYDELVVGLDSLADLALHFKNADRISWVSATTQLLTPLHDSWIGGMSLEGAKLYGLMNPSTRARIRRGESVRFMELGTATVRGIEAMILDGDLTLTSRPKPVDQSLPEVERRVISQFRGLMSGENMFGMGGEYERTEVLGLTNPQMAMIATEVFHGPCLVPVTDEGKRVKNQPIMSDFEMGLVATFMEELKDDPDMMAELEELKTVKAGERDLMMMQLVLTPRVVASAMAYDDRVSRNAPRESLLAWFAKYPEVVASVKRVMDRFGFLDFGESEYRATPP